MDRSDRLAFAGNGISAAGNEVGYGRNALLRKLGNGHPQAGQNIYEGMAGARGAIEPESEKQKGEWASFKVEIL